MNCLICCSDRPKIKNDRLDTNYNSHIRLSKAKTVAYENSWCLQAVLKLKRDGYKAKYIKAIEEKKQPKSNITSKFKRGKKGQTEKATNKTNPQHSTNESTCQICHLKFKIHGLKQHITKMHTNTCNKA